MKYQLNGGRIMTGDELKALYCSMHPAHNKDIEFGFWLNFVVEKGTIKKFPTNIEPFVSCKSVMKANIYKFSSKWRKRNEEKIAEILENRKAKKAAIKKQDSMV